MIYIFIKTNITRCRHEFFIKNYVKKIKIEEEIKPTTEEVVEEENKDDKKKSPGKTVKKIMKIMIMRS